MHPKTADQQSSSLLLLKALHHSLCRSRVASAAGLKARDTLRAARADGLQPSLPGGGAAFFLIVGFILLAMSALDRTDSRHVSAWMGGIYMTLGLILVPVHYRAISPRRGLRRHRGRHR